MNIKFNGKCEGFNNLFSVKTTEFTFKNNVTKCKLTIVWCPLLGKIVNAPIYSQFTGKAVCNESDEYDRRKGHNIAQHRAYQKVYYRLCKYLEELYDWSDNMHKASAIYWQKANLKISQHHEYAKGNYPK